MARGKKATVVKVSEEELRESNIKEDYLKDRRSKTGFIKLSLSSKGIDMANKKTEREIEEKQKELELLLAKKNIVEKDVKQNKASRKKSKKELKKEKKRLKKEKEKLKKMPKSSRILLGAIEEYKDKYHKSKKDKEAEGSFKGLSSKEKRKAPQLTDEEKEQRRLEREKRDFDKKFEEPVTLLRQTVVEVDKTLEDVDGLIKETKESRARNRGTMLKDLFAAKTGLLANRTANARAIGDLQKSRLDMEFKKQKEAGADGNQRNREIALIAKAFPQLISSGAAGSPPPTSDKKSKRDDGDKKGKRKGKRRASGAYEDSLMSRTSELLKSGDLELSPHEASIEMEGKYQIAIRKSFKNHDWDFVAIDNDGSEIRDFKKKYPGLLPKKKHHNLRFDDNKDLAKCTKTDQVFQVIPVPYL